MGDEIVDIINDNNFRLPQDAEEVATMLVDTIYSTWDLPFSDEELKSARQGVIRRWKRIIINEKGMFT